VDNLKNSIYEFKPEDAERFARERGIPAQKRGDELRFNRCPYCLGKTDDKNTFAINLKTGQFKCLRATCGAKGNMITLSRDFGFSLGRDVDAYFNRQRFRDLRKYGKPEVRTPAVEYMESRGISKAVAERYGITTQKEHDNILVFPFYDEDGALQFVKYRKTDFDKTKDSNKEWCEANCKPILFGMDQVPKHEKTLIITEGQIDSLSVCASFGGGVAVSVPTGAKGFTWVPYCWDFLCRFDTLIVFGDYEHGHITLLEEMRERFPGTVKHVRPEDYKDCKDANEILMKYGRQAVIDAVENAVVVDDPHVRRLAGIERRDMGEAIDTGITKLNRTIGGFFLGQLVILTGERGLGKSTLGSQFVLEAVRQHYVSLIYSGELNDWQVQEWLDRQVAGPQHINRQVTRLGFENFLIDGDVTEKLHRWYEDYLYIVENSLGVEDPEPILDTLKNAVRQYGVKVIFIDNLMTAISDDLAADLYRQQAAFVRKLAEMAKIYQVLIILVAHPRKMNREDFTNDDISGSSNISDLAHIVLKYGKPKKEATTDAPRTLAITKNRNNGWVNFDGIELYFEMKSKRISERPNEFDWACGWENESDMWHDDAPDDIPF
jgi:archaellum biogenesis ATPase FlaH